MVRSSKKDFDTQLNKVRRAVEFERLKNPTHNVASYIGYNQKYQSAF